MTPDSQHTPSRRQFLKHSIRWTLLGAAFALGTTLGARKGRSTRCLSPCAQCRELKNCPRPEAQATRYNA